MDNDVSVPDPQALMKWLRDERHEQDLTEIYADDLEALRDLLRIRREARRFARKVIIDD